MESYQKLLIANRERVRERLELRVDYFERMAHDQTPEFLWIGCSDSRVPAEDVTGAEPGELFVHRNIANLVIHTDFNVASVLHYAVEVLRVKHIIVCGHYGCGGVKNALSNKNFGVINKWLRHIKDVYFLHRPELESIADPDEKYRRLVELNVIEQVRNLAKTHIIQRAWQSGEGPLLHGWVYDIRTGYLNDLTVIQPGSEIEDIYRFDFAE